MNKTCSKCGTSKPISEFSKMSAAKNGLQSRCKSCSQLSKRAYYQDNREELLAYAREYNKEHKEDIAVRMKVWRKRNGKHLSEYSREWDKNHKEHVKERAGKYWKEKYSNDLSFRISHNLRCRLKAALRGSAGPLKELDCSMEELKLYLENQFQPGMSWENYGEWHIDHIMPLSSFDLTDREEYKKACHYANLQPLWKRENLRKGNNVELENDNQSGS